MFGTEILRTVAFLVGFQRAKEWQEISGLICMPKKAVESGGGATRLGSVDQIHIDSAKGC